VRSWPPHLTPGLASPDCPLHLGFWLHPRVSGDRKTDSHRTSVCVSPLSLTAPVFCSTPDRTSLPTSCPNPEEERMARPARRPIAVAPSTVDDLREEFLASCRAKNLSDRTVEWYEEKSRRFAEWCSQDGAPDVANLIASHLDAFLIDQGPRLRPTDRARLRAGREDPVSLRVSKGLHRRRPRCRSRDTEGAAKDHLDVHGRPAGRAVGRAGHAPLDRRPRPSHPAHDARHARTSLRAGDPYGLVR